MLLELRRGRGLAQEDLATRVDVSRQTVSNWEKDLASPSLEDVIKLARALDVSTSVFLPKDPLNLPAPGWETLARRLNLSYGDALRLRSLLADKGAAETASTEEALLVWMRDQKVL